MKKLAMLLALATVSFAGCGAPAAQNSTESAPQSLFVVKSQYRIVTNEAWDNQFGIALVDANPTVIQNYLHIRIDTRISKRVYTSNGAYDQQIAPSSIFAHLQPGQIVRVEAGRDWDNTLVAYKIWF